MSFYRFSPSPDLATREEVFATWDNGFDEAQLARIEKLGDSLAIADATLEDAARVDTVLRKAKTGWIALSAESEWLYDRLAFIVRQLNGQFFDFDLAGFVEDFQYTIYGAGQDHYTWHLDKGVSNAAPRKLSLVLQLSDPAAYDGGDLELMSSSEPKAMTRKRGFVVAFPSWVLHRVTPVTRGTRKTVVVWVAGPKFR